MSESNKEGAVFLLALAYLLNEYMCASLAEVREQLVVIGFLLLPDGSQV